MCICTLYCKAHIKYTPHPLITASVFQIVASLYLVMVVVMVGLNYRLRGRSSSKSRTRSAEDAAEELEEAEGEASLEPIPYRAASVCFTEAKGSFSSLVSAETWSQAIPTAPRPPARLVQVWARRTAFKLNIIIYRDACVSQKDKGSSCQRVSNSSSQP